MLKIYNAENIVDAQLLCDELCSDNIEAEVHGGYLSGAGGEIPVDGLVTVWIHHETHETRAKNIVKNFEALRNSSSRLWTCDKCGESVEGNFTLCWHCGEQLPQAT